MPAFKPAAPCSCWSSTVDFGEGVLDVAGAVPAATPLFIRPAVPPWLVAAVGEPLGLADDDVLLLPPAFGSIVARLEEKIYNSNKKKSSNPLQLAHFRGCLIDIL